MLYRVHDSGGVTSAREFCFWGWEENGRGLKVISAKSGRIIALVDRKSNIYVMHDFQTKVSWPLTWVRHVNQDARELLSKLKNEHGDDLWLYRTYSGELERPRHSFAFP
jgi:hypothetical protein